MRCTLSAKEEPDHMNVLGCIEHRRGCVEEGYRCSQDTPAQDPQRSRKKVVLGWPRPSSCRILGARCIPRGGALRPSPFRPVPSKSAFRYAVEQFASIMYYGLTVHDLAGWRRLRSTASYDMMRPRASSPVRGYTSIRKIAFA